MREVVRECSKVREVELEAGEDGGAGEMSME